MNILFIFTSSVFFLWVIRELFYWLAIWQENEYRQDRFFASFKRRTKKNKLNSLAFFILKWIVFFLYFFIVFNDNFLIEYQDIVIVLYLLQAIFLIKEIYSNHLKKPAITLRSTIIIFLTLITILFIFSIPLMDKFFWLVFIDLITPLIVAFYVLIFLFPIEIYNDWQIEKSGQKIREHHNLLVIAVTGSTGKSLTKEYIAAILGRKFRVIKTDGKNNTAIGVAKTILNKLDNDTEIFVAEISAYQQGEIEMLCKLIRPKIGVLTAINNHYVTLFKNLANIEKTNFELVESLPKNGICLFNGNNKSTFNLYKKSKKNKILYRTSRTISAVAPSGNEIVASDIVHKQKRTTLNITLNNNVFNLNLNNSVHLDQLLPAIYLASYLGMPVKEIKRNVEILK